MPLRSRLRRAFTRGAHDDPQVVKGKKSKNCDPNVYQPGEKMPPLKYRRPVAPEHKAHLESFDWAKAWRRKSTASIYSPMGSRMPSRKSSFSSFRTRRSVRSVHGRRSQSKPRRGDDYRENDSGIGASLSGDHQLIEDSDDEGDITNVGLSRNPTEDPKRPRKSSVSSNGSRPPTATTEDPFDPEDLEVALQKTTLDPNPEESERSGTIGPANPSDAPTSPVQSLPGPEHGPEFYDRLRPRERLIAFDDDHTFESISDPPRAGTY
ncbi:hypothetical protein PMIN03_007979 [Paraphaeosphaeria minitans]|uniref:Uncharacterized protein n=1 Tax=Paraphaeosphaeria minitans TaxID=565426 RepID=A0A9P6KPP2_9PLEO|nr:hypothetical protein PMIN01_07133 [Paraphaeosphaeria minitans]